MSEQTTPEINPASQRHWMYGSNSILMSVLALIVALILLGAAYKVDASYHFELHMGSYSLSDNTKDKLDQLNQKSEKYRLISLFTDPSDEIRRNDVTMANKIQHQRKQVLDLLEQYRRFSPNITVEDKGDASIDELIRVVRDRYTKDFKAYQDAVADYSPLVKKLDDFLSDEGTQIGAAAQKPAATDDDRAIAGQFQSGFRDLRERLQEAQAIVKFQTANKLPDWSGIRDQIAGGFSTADGDYPGMRDLETQFEMFGDVAQLDQRLPKEDQLPPGLKAYFTAASQHYKDMAADLKKYLDRLDQLPPLKEAQEVTQNLTRNTVLILGDKTAKVVSYADIYPRFSASQGHDETFVGETAITDDLYSMTFPDRRIKLVFATAAPEHLLDDAFSTIKSVLERKNFEVSEWSPGEGAPPAEGSGAVWVVCSPDQPADTSKLEAATRRHLEKGGAALFLVVNPGPMPTDVNATPFASILKDYGIEVQTKYQIIHMVTDKDNNGQPVQRAIPFIGYLPTPKESQMLLMGQESALDQPLMLSSQEITEAMAGMPVIFGPMRSANQQTGQQQEMGDLAVVKLLQPLPSGVQAEEIVKTPNSSAYWGESNPMQQPPQFDAKDDLPGPVPMEAEAIMNQGKDNERRVAVLGCKYLASNMFLAQDDLPLTGNEQLFVNTVRWLAKQKVYAETSGVGYVEMSSTRQTWFGVILLGILPAAVLAAAGISLMTRRR